MSPVSESPLYQQVEATLKEMIEDLVYSPGDQIPSERELAEQLGVSRMTARKAIDNLVQHGLLERKSTSGTYVSLPKVVRPVGKGYAVGLTQLLRSEGAEPGAQLLAFETIMAPRKIAEKLDLRLGAPVLVLRRLRTVNSLPFCVETSYIPPALVPGLTAADLSGDSSFYEILASRFSVRVAKNDEILSISFATRDEAHLLGMVEGDPVLLTRALVLDVEGRPVEYVKSVNHPERVVFQTITKLG